VNSLPLYIIKQMHASNEQILKLKLAARCAVSGCWPSCLRPAFPASRVQHISDLHSKFALRPHSMVDIQSAAAEIRRGKKKEERNHRAKI